MEAADYYITASPAGTAQAVPIIPSHTAENETTTACKHVFVEKK